MIWAGYWIDFTVHTQQARRIKQMDRVFEVDLIELVSWHDNVWGT